MLWLIILVYPGKSYYLLERMFVCMQTEFCVHRIPIRFVVTIPIAIYFHVLQRFTCGPVIFYKKSFCKLKGELLAMIKMLKSIFHVLTLVGGMAQRMKINWRSC